MKSRLALAFVLVCIAFGAWAQLFTPSVPFTRKPNPAALFDFCASSGVLTAPCSGGTVSSQTLTTNSITIVSKFTSPAFRTPPTSATTVSVTLYGSQAGSTTLSKVCIGIGGGSKAWDFGAAPTPICGSGAAPACPSYTSSGVILPTTNFVLGGSSTLMVAADFVSSTWSRPFYNPKVSPVNTSPAATAITNYNGYNKAGVQEGCTQSKGASYTANSSGTNQIYLVQDITVQ